MQSNPTIIVYDPDKDRDLNQDDELLEEEHEYVDDDPRERPQFGEEVCSG